ncbi:Ulp1 family isopeptidase [Mesorhizobium caraganae]|uniref:Ulp1 family isopeptidase n=1 Tax=Mesorhizobium caraganae TaxID=483206 RepID=UPI001FEE1DF9|nr:Ulp1 family isopeptidase [Mesorhizobium caraganae]
MRQYRALQQQQRARQQSDNMPAGQASFEQQLSDLQLSSSGESSGEASSPDTRPAEAHGRIPRSDIGGSMRMPPQPSQRDNQFSSARHSIDTSYAASSRSRSRHSTASSEACSSSLEEPVIAPQPKKSGGWKSFLKTVKKAIVPCSGTKSSKDRTHQPDVIVKTTYRTDYAKRSRVPDEVVRTITEDESLIENFITMTAEVGERQPGSHTGATGEKYAGVLRQFSEWLQGQPNSPTLAGLLDAPDDSNGLTARAATFVKQPGGARIKAALNMLKQVRAGVAPMGRVTLDPYPDDARLIDGLLAHALANLPPGATVKQRRPLQNRASHQRQFSEWLKREGRASIASRVKSDWDGLNEDLRAFFEAIGGRRTVGLSSLWEMQEPHRGPQVSSRPSAEDESLIKGFIIMTAEVGKRQPGSHTGATGKRYAVVLRKFSKWLQGQPNSPTLAGLLDAPDDPDDPNGLTARAAKFVKQPGGAQVNNALAALRQVRAGVASKGRATLDPYPDDARLIDGLLAHALANLPPGATVKQRRPLQNRASHQREFSEWLKREGRASIASRAKSDWVGLNEDLQAFFEAIEGRRTVGLSRLRQYLQVVEANRALGVDSPEQPGQGPAGSPMENYGQDELFDELSQRERQRPAGSLSTYGQDEFFDELSEFGWQGPAGSTSTWSPHVSSDFHPKEWPSPRAPSSHIYSDLESIIGLPSTPHELRDDARSAPAWDIPPSFAGPSAGAPDLSEISHIVGHGWRHGSQPASANVINILENVGLAPTQFVPKRRYLIHGELYTAELGLGGSVHFIRHSGAGQTDAQASGSGAPLTLGDTQWLGDEHILRDYNLLRGELQRNNPDLAARTRFVDPLVAQLLREGAESDAERHLQPILRGQGGSDTANFLFLPVNDATADPNRRGSHWSLLLVDRRPSEGAVAYHYDSAGGYNSASAAQLAGRLGARLVPVRMTQQENGHDCGVLVLEATRALVGRMAQRRPQVLDLDNLVADRRALQERLRR